MLKKGIFIFITLCLSFIRLAHSQSEMRNLRQGNDDYRNERFNEAEINYRKSLEVNPNNYRALYNLGNALYRQGNFEEAARILNGISEMDISRKNKAKVYHNLGNAFLKSDKLNESIDAYKNALRLNPDDMETKYNLTYALSKLQEQQDQQCQNDQNDNQDDNQDDNQEQNQQQEQQENGQQDEQPQQQNEISREDAERILDALERQEQNVQDKLKREQTPVRIKIEKDW